MNPILIDFPESFESERLIIRAPQPSDGTEMNAAIRETLDDLRIWMPWAKEQHQEPTYPGAARV